MEPVFDRKYFRELQKELQDRVEDLKDFLQKNEITALILLTLLAFLIFIQQVILIAISSSQ